MQKYHEYTFLMWRKSGGMTLAMTNRKRITGTPTGKLSLHFLYPPRKPGDPAGLHIGDEFDDRRFRTIGEVFAFVIDHNDGWLCIKWGFVIYNHKSKRVIFISHERDIGNRILGDHIFQCTEAPQNHTVDWKTRRMVEVVADVQ
jgi:hypothetical protein